jgi:hypothetical protein
MKKLMFGFVLVLLFASCNSSVEQYLGEWHVNNGYYQAGYRITQTDNGTLNAQVMYLNDGTTIYTEDKTTLFLFTNYDVDANHGIDGKSGATSTKNNKQSTNYKLEIVTPDTLCLSYSQAGKAIREYWFKK